MTKAQTKDLDFLRSFMMESPDDDKLTPASLFGRLGCKISQTDDICLFLAVTRSVARDVVNKTVARDSKGAKIIDPRHLLKETTESQNLALFFLVPTSLTTQTTPFPTGLTSRLLKDSVDTTGTMVVADGKAVPLSVGWTYSYMDDPSSAKPKVACFALETKEANDLICELTNQDGTMNNRFDRAACKKVVGDDKTRNVMNGSSKDIYCLIFGNWLYTVKAQEDGKYVYAFDANEVKDKGKEDRPSPVQTRAAGAKSADQPVKSAPAPTLPLPPPAPAPVPPLAATVVADAVQSALNTHKRKRPADVDQQPKANGHVPDGVGNDKKEDGVNKRKKSKTTNVAISGQKEIVEADQPESQVSDLDREPHSPKDDPEVPLPGEKQVQVTTAAATTTATTTAAAAPTIATVRVARTGAAASKRADGSKQMTLDDAVELIKDGAKGFVTDAVNKALKDGVSLGLRDGVIRHLSAGVSEFIRQYANVAKEDLVKTCFGNGLLMSCGNEVFDMVKEAKMARFITLFATNQKSTSSAVGGGSSSSTAAGAGAGAGGGVQ